MIFRTWIVDITIEEGIDVLSIQAEQFQVLIQLAGTQPGSDPAGNTDRGVEPAEQGRTC